MKTKLCSLLLGLCCGVFALAARAEETNATALVPQEARRFFVMGVTLFKDAKTPEEFSEAAGKFRQATTAAPQWPEARYNLALAEEAAGDYAGANADLKTYLNFKLPAEEAQKVQDKIYTLEAKAEKAAKQRAEEQRLAEAKRAEQDRQQDAISLFVGEWLSSRDNDYYIKIRRGSDGHLTIVLGNKDDTFVASNVKIKGNEVYFDHIVPRKLVLKDNGCLLVKSSNYPDGRDLEESQGVEYCRK